jgi:1-acyl-sn-glycerol-3-phosphate acyltransferase
MMVWLRSFIFALGMWIFTPLYTLVILLSFPCKPHTRYRVIRQWSRIMLAWLRLTCGLTYRVVGQENIPPGPAVILAKHQSAWETLALQSIFPPQVWVLKRELLRLPFFGWALALSSPIAIDRGTARQALKQLLDQGKERLAQGFCVVIFPEGTRMAPGTRGKYKVGGAWLATNAGAPAVPVAHNAGEFWARNAFLKRAGVITVSIGKPIYPDGIKADELNTRVEDWIEAEMQRIARDFEGGPLAPHTSR